MTDKPQYYYEETAAQVPAFSYYVLRHQLLPELLGEDEAAILYWAGKSLARKNKEFIKADGVDLFFSRANWGRLKLVKEKKKERIYEFYSSHQSKESPFSLEAGFLSQAVEMEKELISEASYEIKSKKPLTLTITVRWDLKDAVPNESDA